MLAWKKLGKHLVVSLLIFLGGTLLITIFSFLNILKGNTLAISKFLVSFLSFFIGAYLQGKCATKKGFLEGLKIGSILVAILFLINYGTYQMFELKNLLYYLLLMMISMVGGMLGISRKKEKK